MLTGLAFIHLSYFANSFSHSVFIFTMVGLKKNIALDVFICSTMKKRTSNGDDTDDDDDNDDKHVFKIMKVWYSNKNSEKKGI